MKQFEVTWTSLHPAPGGPTWFWCVPVEPTPIFDQLVAERQ